MYHVILAIRVCLQQLILIRKHHQAHTCSVFFVIADTSVRSPQKLAGNEIIEIYKHVRDFHLRVDVACICRKSL